MLSTKKIFGLDFVDSTMNEVYEYVLEKLNNNELFTIYTPNSELVLYARKNKEYKSILSQANLLLPDGSGIKICSRIMKKSLKEKINGFDFAQKILKDKKSKNLSVYLLGANEKNVSRAAANIKKDYPHINLVGYQNGYFKEYEEEKIIKQINELKPDILFVALGFPKQESFINKHKKQLKNVGVAIAVGGTIDVLSGNTSLAPEYIRNLGFEWLYRTILEPKKRIKRVIKLPFILLLAFYYRFKN